MALVGARLFLPQDWVENPARCRKVGVPEERIAQGHLTKIDHARELVEEAIGNGVQFACVSMDALYGRNAALRKFMAEKGLVYCMDIPSDTRLFAGKPGQDERPKKITTVTQRADELARQTLLKKKKNGTQTIQLRDGDNGSVEAKVTALRVWTWGEFSEEAQEEWLVIRAMPDGSTKLSLCNASATTSLKRLARWQAGRFWIERCFQDAKSHCGMSQYQARGWHAWHHPFGPFGFAQGARRLRASRHMALVALAVLFQMEERLSDPAGIGNLTAGDITEMIEWAIIRQPTESELLERIERRHQARARSKTAALRRQRKARRKSQTSENHEVCI